MEEKRILMVLKENYDSGIEEIEFLRDSGGIVYIVKKGKQKFLLKIVKKAFRDTVCQSVEILSYLSENQCKMPKRDFSFFIGRYIEILHRKKYPRVNAYEELGRKLWECVKNCPVGGCHGDLHRGNLLETESGVIYLLDFDTVCTAPYMFDVAVMCDMTDYFNLQTEDIRKTEEFYSDFLKGYARHRIPAETELATLDTWIAIRHFQLQATIVEIYGLDCIDHNFIDAQLAWLERWCRK